EGRDERGHEHYQIHKSPKKEFKNTDEPALTINIADRQENLRHERDPEKRDNRTRDLARSHAVEPDCCENDQHDPDVQECVNVEGVNQVIDVKNASTDVKNLED